MFRHRDKKLGLCSSQCNSPCTNKSSSQDSYTLRDLSRGLTILSDQWQTRGLGKVKGLTRELGQEPAQTQAAAGWITLGLWTDLESRDNNNLFIIKNRGNSNLSINKIHSSSDSEIQKGHLIRWICSRFRTPRALYQWTLRGTRTNHKLSSLTQPPSTKTSSLDLPTWELVRLTRTSKRLSSTLKTVPASLPPPYLPRHWSRTRCPSTNPSALRAAPPVSSTHSTKSHSTTRTNQHSETKNRYAFWTSSWMERTKRKSGCMRVRTRDRL